MACYRVTPLTVTRLTEDVALFATDYSSFAAGVAWLPAEASAGCAGLISSQIVGDEEFASSNSALSAGNIKSGFPNSVISACNIKFGSINPSKSTGNNKSALLLFAYPGVVSKNNLESVVYLKTYELIVLVVILLKHLLNLN